MRSKLLRKTYTPGYDIAIFHDEGYREQGIDVEVQRSVVGTYKDTAKVHFKTVEPIIVATLIFKGAYDWLREANEAIANWISNNNYEFDKPMFNIYHCYGYCCLVQYLAEMLPLKEATVITRLLSSLEYWYGNSNKRWDEWNCELFVENRWELLPYIYFTSQTKFYHSRTHSGCKYTIIY